MYKGSLRELLTVPQGWAEYRQAWSLAEKREILTSHPLHLDIELTSQCNLKCEMCWQNGLLKENSQGMMKEKIFKEIIQEGVPLGLSAIKLQSRGESTLHPRLPEFARFAKEAGVKDVQLTTNGTVLTKESELKKLITCGLDKLIFSVDSKHDESARKIYKNRAPDVLTIIKRAIDIKKSEGNIKPIIRIQSIADPGLTNDAKLELLKSVFPGANEYLVNDLFDADTSDEYSTDLSQTYELLPCEYLWTRVVVFWNGDVGLCCRDFNVFHNLGNVERNSIKDIWLGPRMTSLRKAHLDGQRVKTEICKNCERAIRPRPIPSRAA